MLVPDAEGLAALGEADVILSLDWVDLAGTLKAAQGAGRDAKVIQVSLDHRLHNGWSMDHQGLPPVDLFLAADPEHVVPVLLEALGAASAAAPRAARRTRRPLPAGPLTVEHLARALREAVGDAPLLAHPSAAVLERRVVAVPPSARLPRLRRRRRRRRRVRASRSARRWR